MVRAKAHPADKDPAEAKREKDPRLPEARMRAESPGGSAPLGQASHGPDAWLGSLPGELKSGSPVEASLAEWQKRGEARPYACPECGKNVGFPLGLPEHQPGHGPHRLLLPAPPRGESLLAHALACQPQEEGAGGLSPGQADEKGWSCPWCQEHFRLRVNLLIHQSGHLEAAPGEAGSRDRLACRFCPRRFGRSDHLLRHQMSHTGARPYQCPACEKSFTDKSKLTNHYRTHTGERPFRCAACGKRFIRRHHLAKHQRTHTRERPHQCPTCLKSFMQKHHLQKHVRTHTGEKPYACGRCPQAFSCRQRLLQHFCASAPAGAAEAAAGGVGPAP